MPPKGHFYSSTAIGGGVVVTEEYDCLNIDPAHRSSVHAFDVSTGRETWHTPSDGTTLAAIDVSDGVVPVYVDDRQIAGLDAKTGEERWRLPASEARVEPRGDLMLASQSGDHPLNAYDSATGKLRWSFWPRDDPDWHGNAEVVAGNERSIVLASGGYSGRGGSSSGQSLPGGPTTLWLLGAEDGTLQARTIVQDPQFLATDAALIDALLVYIDGADLMGRDLNSGSIRWQRLVPGDPAAIALGLGSLGFNFDTSSDGRTILWRRPNRLENLHPPGPPIETIAYDATSGNRLWTRPGAVFDYANTYSPIGSKVAVLVIGDQTYPIESHDSLVGIDTRQGSELWRVPIPREIAKREIAVRTNDKIVAISSFCNEHD